MTTNKRNLLLRTTLFPPGVPISMNDLSAVGVSRDLAVYYVNSGWLTRLAPGVYMRPGDLDLNASLRMLESSITGLHIGGRCALDRYGIKQYVRFRERLDLFGFVSAHLPTWFTQVFPSNYKRKRIFSDMNFVSRHPNGGPLTSEPERALLEMYSEVGLSVNLNEAVDIAENAFSLRADVLQELINQCISHKAVNLCIKIANDKGLPYAALIKGK